MASGEHEHAHGNAGHAHHAHGAPASRSRLALVILFNAAITAAEFVGGALSGSLALISDAGHNLSDVLALALGYAGERVSERKPDKRFSFGLKRFEVVVALVNALTLLGIGFYIVYEASARYLHPVQIDVRVMLPVAAIGLAGNLFSMLLLVKERGRTLNLKAAFLHLLYDTISSVAVIAAGIVLYVTGIALVDLVMSLAIVLMIAASSFGIIRESARIIMQGTPAHMDTDEIRRDIAAVEKVGSVHGLHVWSINSNEVFLSCHICLDDPAGGGDTDAIIKNVNAMLERNYGISHTTIQVETTRICTDPNLCCR